MCRPSSQADRKDRAVITEAQREDANEIYEVFKRADQNPWSRQMIADSFENESCTFLILRKDEAIGGVAVFMSAADEAELLHIAVLPELRGGGMGRRLLLALLERAREQGAVRLFLEVRASNKIAGSL